MVLKNDFKNIFNDFLKKQREVVNKNYLEKTKMLLRFCWIKF